ncbi:MAG: nucleoside deaminase [Firmicutes bacterium]|nr:nucleoside deaminase [Bacillota bacterium]
MKYMELALEMARKAGRKGEVPIGAVIVRNDKVIAKAYNRRERTQNALAHAEVLAIDKACRRLRSWRLDDCDIYVTLQPCQMCIGAIINARIRHLYYGAATTTDLNHTTPETLIDTPECSEILKQFFLEKRPKVNNNPKA